MVIADLGLHLINRIVERKNTRYKVIGFVNTETSQGIKCNPIKEDGEVDTTKPFIFTISTQENSERGVGVGLLTEVILVED